MNSLQQGSELEKLTRILSTINDLYIKKKEQLEDLELEIEELRTVLNQLKMFISTKSFQSADEILTKNIADLKTTLLKEDEYFKDEISIEKVRDTELKRKIFSRKGEECEEGELLCILKFKDFNKVEIKFVNPSKTAIKETSLSFINKFLKGALIAIKKDNPDLDVKYDLMTNSDIIEYIHILNLKSIKEYDLITEKMQDLLSTSDE